VVELVSGVLLVTLGIIMVWGKMEALLEVLGMEGFLPEQLLVR
jgi:hypothetical protein